MKNFRFNALIVLAIAALTMSAAPKKKSILSLKESIKNQCQRLNGHLQHGVVGLKGGKILQPHTRCRQRSGEGIVMAAHEAVELIGQRGEQIAKRSERR